MRLTTRSLFHKLRSMVLEAARWLAVWVWIGVDLGCASPTPPSASRPALAASATASGRVPRAPKPIAGSKLGTPGPTTPAAHSKLRVGTSGDYAPFSIRGTDGQPLGFEPEIAAAMAEDLGFDLEWVGFRWPTLQAQLENEEFDLAMSGISWQPTRAVTGYLTRAVAQGGPCVLGDESAARVAVNRGGALETWARAHFAGRELLTLDANQTLPELLASGRAGAIVTDSFERKGFARPGWSVRCEPARWRKVYWLAPNHLQLAGLVETWLATHRARIQSAQERWFGERQRLDALDNLIDLLARRMAFMPLVAGAKAMLGLPIEDLPREQIVLDAAAASARKVGLPEAEARAFFALQIELSKSVQRRNREPATLDLTTQIRPALNELGDRILAAVIEARGAGQLDHCALADLDLLSPWLNGTELQRLLDALRALGR